MNDVDGDAQDGGSGYGDPWDWVNVLKTGNLIFEMAFYGDGPAVPRLQDALDYLSRTWNDPSGDPGWGNGAEPHYQAMYCIMKGLEYRGIETLVVDGVERDWFNDFADAIIANQQEDGSWPWDYWGGTLLATEWALLTLEKSAPPVAEVNGQCILAGESFEPVDLDETVDPNNPGTPPYTWTVSGNVDLLVALDDENVMTVTYPEGWIGEEVLTIGCEDASRRSTVSYPTFTVCANPQVLDIPDQTAPFTPIDLNNYIAGIDPSDVIWNITGAPESWTVTIDENNVATITAPGDASDPAVLTFTATSIACSCEEPSSSDQATFIFNQPPDCSAAYADPSDLWPPNHKFVSVAILGVSDPDGDPTEIEILAITSDEPTATDKGSGGAKHAPDAQGVGTNTPQVRAERSGKRNGRVYQVLFSAQDTGGAECSGSVTICVPHDQGGGNDCIDDGQRYDATAIN
ncbi:MAG: hypothetical protein QNJ97_22240 [Myxococcota bacterium]|nr:hypothetical protein [Myxococcota bacterium]